MIAPWRSRSSFLAAIFLISLGAAAPSAFSADSPPPRDAASGQGRLFRGDLPALALFSWTGVAQEPKQIGVAESGGSRERRKAMLEGFESTLKGVGDVGVLMARGFTREVVVKGGFGSQQRSIGSFRYPIAKPPDNWKDFYSMTEFSGAAGKLLKWSSLANNSASQLRKEGFLLGTYLVGKEIAISEFSEKIGSWVAGSTFQILTSVGTPALVPVNSVIAWAAGEIAEQATKGLLEAAFAALEALLRELFSELATSDELDQIVESGLSALDGELQKRLSQSQPITSIDPNALRGRLDSLPDPTLGVIAKTIVEGWAVLKPDQPVPNAPTPPSSGDITVYDIQISGVEAGMARKGWAIRRCLPKDIAASSIRTSLQTTADEDYNGNKAHQFIGVIKEYKVTQEWLNREGVKHLGYIGLDFPKYRPSRTYP